MRGREMKKKNKREKRKGWKKKMTARRNKKTVYEKNEPLRR